MRPTVRNFAMLFLLLGLAYYLIFSLGTLKTADTFEKYLRHTFFSSFLGIGSFVFALMTAILFNMRDKVYADKEYITIFLNSESGKKGNISIYEPLTEIGNLFIFTVICCLLTALSQITIGLYVSDATAAICMSSATTTLILILFVVYKVKRTMQSWFNILLRQILPAEYEKT